MTTSLDFTSPMFAEATDLALAIFKPLEQDIAGLTVASRIPPEDTLSTPLLLVRAEVSDWTSDSYAGNDTRFIHRAQLNIQAFTSDPDGETKGELLSQIALLRLRTVKENQTVFPGLGHVTSFRTNTPYHAASDWATGQGVVQYANINKGFHRFEAKYGITYRPDFDNPIDMVDVLNILSDS